MILIGGKNTVIPNKIANDKGYSLKYMRPSTPKWLPIYTSLKVIVW